MLTVQNYVARPRRARKSLQTVQTASQRFYNQFAGQYNPLTNPMFSRKDDRLILDLILQSQIHPSEYENVRFIELPDDRMAPLMPTRSKALVVEVADDARWRKVIGEVIVYVDGYDKPIAGSLTKVWSDRIELTPVDTDQYPVLVFTNEQIYGLFSVRHCNGRTLTGSYVA